MQETLDFLRQRFGSPKLLINEPMKNHTSFKVGGNVSAMLLPCDVSDIMAAVDACEQYGVFCFVMGNGSNLLVSDGGIDGLVIKITGNMNRVYLSGPEEITAEAGCLLSEAAAFALSNCLSGMEFAAGIPGSVGGGVYMNAGAYDGEIKNILTKARAIINGKVTELPAEALGFDYRNSIFQTNSGIITEAVFKLKKGDYSRIEDEMKRLNAKRRAKQPLDKPSAGSTFTKPEGHFAGDLIAKCGLAGFSVGGACVSPKHCGFIINNGSATAEDIRRLMDYVKTKVYEEFGVMLKPEVKMVGNF